MRRQLLLLVVSLIVSFGFLPCSVMAKASTDAKEIENYSQIIDRFEEVNADQILEEQLDYPVFLYLGRESCPFCRDFVELLESSINYLEEDGLKIFYLNTENSQSDADIQKVGEKFHLKTVPSFLYITPDKKVDKFLVDQMSLTNCIQDHLADESNKVN